MSVAAVMLVRDEADIIEASVRNLLDQDVDWIYVSDNRSVDGTSELLAALASETGRMTVTRDPEVGYWQSRKTTALARGAFEDGHAWVVPCDADEIWLPPPGTPLDVTVGRTLRALRPDVQVARAALYDFVETAFDDPTVDDPTLRLRWRLPDAGALPKVAARLSPHLTIHAGNHGADYGGRPFVDVDALIVRHYTWRGADRYVRKILNGMEAYAATDLPETFGHHWRKWATVPDDDREQAIRDHYYEWFQFASTDALVFDPLPEEE